MSQRPPRLPWILFALLSVVTFVGPFAIWLAIRGGDHDGWPPDRPIEWWMLLGIISLFAILMVASIGTAAASLRRLENSGATKADLDLHLGPPSETKSKADLELHLGQSKPPRKENGQST